jgi:thiamine transport system permease protein
MKRLLILLPLAFLAIFFCYPLVSITARGLAPSGVIDLSAFGEIVGSEFDRQTLWFTFWQATVSAVLTIIAALPVACVAARDVFCGKSSINALTQMSFFMTLIGLRGYSTKCSSHC